MGSHQRVSEVVVNEPGPFLAALAVPEEGEVAVTLTNRITPWWPAEYVGHRVGPLVGWIPGATLRNDFVLRRVGWLR